MSINKMDLLVNLRNLTKMCNNVMQQVSETILEFPNLPFHNMNEA